MKSPFQHSSLDFTIVDTTQATKTPLHTTKYTEQDTMTTPTITGQQAFTLPVSPLTPLDPNARPTVEAIRLLRGELYENAASVCSQYGGGRNGLLGMLMPPADDEMRQTSDFAKG